MKQVAIVGCGIVGATIAYELSRISGLQVMVFDVQPPAQAATGAALGVLMGIISHKTKGRAWAMRQISIRRYATLIPELEAATGCTIPYNSYGILKLCFVDDDLASWERLITLRQQQEWQLQLWQRDQLRAICPQVQHSEVIAAVYSPQDGQVDPTALTLALVQAAKQNGVYFRFNVQVQGWQSCSNGLQLHTSEGDWTADWVVIAAGLGSMSLSQGSLPLTAHALKMQPVLGQAMRLRLDQPLGNPAFQPVITRQDIHIVPLQNQNNEYWIGATVEFPTADLTASPVADPHRLEAVWQGARALCPALGEATILHTWSGLRPRPVDRAAPIVEPVAGDSRVLLATGHYRNGVLLAPATAQWVCEWIQQSL
ncbi:MAG: FAD-binding oxidoreductase [Synechococcales cyanobacterium M58_A2018_015]|nr:FAD-binding oxidoreductase [Synechococcales cyanobacterium M58_A2018_015]